MNENTDYRVRPDRLDIAIRLLESLMSSGHAARTDSVERAWEMAGELLKLDEIERAKETAGK